MTQREFDYAEDATLMSTTDTQSHITYANAAFIAVSGYERDAVTGQPHNLVRHPDMPREAFADMWSTLKGGESWIALMKNRRCDGDHYWVRANATPMHRNGQLVGYMSVRTKPAREEVAAAEALYRRLREGRAQRLRFHKGLVVRTGLWAWTSALQVLPVHWRLRLAFLATLVVMAAAVLGLGTVGAGAWAAVGATALAGAAACAWLEMQIARPLRDVMRQALSVAAGNPERLRTLDRVDEIGMILRAVNQSGLNLPSLVDDVSEQISGLRIASKEIVSGNNDLSARTEQTASSLQQTAASMEEIHGTVKNSADAARQAAELATSASAAAAREIKGLIGTSVERVEAGSRLVADAGHTMHDIVAQVHRVDQLIAEISRATLEQTAGVGQVNVAVTQLEQTTQQNAALVEQSAAAAGSLSQQAARLSDAVQVFRTSSRG